MQLLGYDIGSSSIKASVIEAGTGREIAFAQSPDAELEIHSPKLSWAEQDPETWWKHVKIATKKVLKSSEVSKERIDAIGISYQMHGLVLVDRNHAILRPAIIWCDGRAVDIGRKAFEQLGVSYCFEHFLNSPGNFTASKLKWVQEHEPDLYERVHKFMLPGDYLAMKLSGDIFTTVSGLSEGILWDYRESKPAKTLLDYYGIEETLLPKHLSTFENHGTLSGVAAGELGLKEGTKLTYRAGDQPNNALSLNVLEPGEAASTAGTSGVIYGVTDKPVHDKHSRVNTFVHISNENNKERYGVLLCINGTGIQNSWLKTSVLGDIPDYETMNKKALRAPIGSEGLMVFPFGNGPERILRDEHIGGQIKGIDFNRHQKKHLIRAAHEGIAFSMSYGLQIMKEMGIELNTIRAGVSNMFLSPVFSETLCNTSGLQIEMFQTNGARGAAIGAGIGSGAFTSREDAFKGLNREGTIKPNPELEKQYLDAYNEWKSELDSMI